MEQEIKVAEKIEEIWRALESISRIDDSRELQRALEHAETLFKFASNILRNKERMFDASFSIHRHCNGECVVGASFDGIHMHAEFVSPDTTLEAVCQQFVDSKVVLKSAIGLLAWALSLSAQAIMEWHVKHY